MTTQQQPDSKYNSQRLAYLHAMGVPVWVHRDPNRSTLPPLVADTHTLTEIRQDDQGDNEATIIQGVVEELSATLSVSTEEPKTVKPASSKTPSEPLEAIDCANSDWASLSTQVSSCQSCVLHTSRNQAVFASGDKTADCIIIGDTPSSEDDRKGQPFVDKAGQLLTNMLKAIDLPRDTVYLTNTTKCRATNDRMPSAEELTQCCHYLFRQIELIKPKKILILGRTTAQHLLQKKAPLSQLRSQIHTLPNTDIPTVVTFHPRLLLKQSKDKRKAWEDLKLFKQIDCS